MQPNIVLVDLCGWHGHHPYYFVKIFTDLEDLGLRVTGLCLDPTDFRYRYSQVRPSARVPDLVPLTKPAPWKLRLFRLADKAWHLIIRRPAIISEYQLDNLSTSSGAIARAGISSETLVFFLHLDSMLMVKPIWLAKLLMPRRWVGLYLMSSYRTPADWGSYPAQSQREKVFESGRCQGIYFLDKGAAEALSSRYRHAFMAHLPETVDLVGDPTSNLPAPIRAAKQAGAKVIGFCGSVSKRKNILNLLRAFQRMADNDVYLVVAGYLEIEDYSEAEQHEFYRIIGENNRIHCEFGTISEEMFNAVIAESEAVFIAYRDFVGSSNVVAKAFHLRRPIVASKGFMIGEVVENYRIGVTVDQDDIDGIVFGLRQIIQGFTVDSRGFDDLISGHDDQRFRESLSRLVPLASGADPGALSPVVSSTLARL